MSKGKPRHPHGNEEIEKKSYQYFSDYFCGCGDPDAALQAFKEIMGIFKEVEEDGDWKSTNIDQDKRKVFEEKHGQGMTYLILYWMSGMKLIEHGGSVGGSWMTALGDHVRLQVLTTDDPDCLAD